jgi:hypothetical protein
MSFKRKNKKCHQANNDGFPKERNIIYVHEAVAEACITNLNKLPYVEHIDGNRLNNHPENLRWTAVKPDGYRGKNVRDD